MPKEPSSTPARPVAVIVRALIGLAALVVAIGIFAGLQATRPTPNLAPVQLVARQVRVLTLSPVEAPRTWLGYGSARSVRSADISAEVQGVVVDRPASIEPGLSVEFGDVVVVIDPSDFRQRATQLEQSIAAFRAEAQGLTAEEASLQRLLELAEEATALQRNEIERWRAAAARSAGAPVELDRLASELSRIQREEQTLRERLSLVPSRRIRIESQIAAEQATLAIAQRDLERTVITSPISGVIQSVAVERGERVAPGSPVARVVDLARIEIPLRIPVSAAASVLPGDRAEVRAEGPIEAVWNGAVARIAPEADDSDRTITVFIEITQSASADGPRLLPGMFVSGRIFSEAPEARLVVPRTALDRDTALVVDDQGVVSSVTVSVIHYLEAYLPELDPVETQWAVIASGLAAGQRIVLTNLDELKPGDIVTPVEASHGFRADSDADEPVDPTPAEGVRP